MNRDAALKIVSYSNMSLWDYNSQFKNKIKSKYPLESLKKYLVEESIKVDLSLEPEKEYAILGISNTEGMFDAYIKKGREFNQKYKIVEENWIAYNPYRVNVGSIGIKSKNIKNKYISPAYVVFRCKENLLPSYLLFILKSDFGNKEIRNNTTGSVRQILGFDRLCHIKIPIPTIEEQLEIMSKFQELERQIKELEEALHTHTHNAFEDIIYRRLGIEKEITSNEGITKLRKVKFKNISRWDFWNKLKDVNSNLYNILELKELIIGKPQYGANEKGVKEKTEIRYIRITDINEDGSLGDEFVSARNVEKKYLLEEDDFLIARSGNTVGKTFLYKEKYGKAIYAGYLVRYKINKELLNPLYLLFYTKSTIFKKWVKAKQRISGQPNINGKEYLSAKIVVPPLNMQNRIARDIQKIYEEKFKLKDEIIKLKKQQKNLIRQIIVKTE